MKHRMLILLAALVILSLLGTAIIAWSDHHSIAGRPYASAITASYEDLKAFHTAMGDKLSQEQRNECVEITPKAVSDETDWRMFTLQSQYSFLLAGGEVHILCNYWGGWGVTSAVPWDYDDNGVLDLLYTYSWGSGIHRSHVAVFDMTTRQEIGLTAIYAEHDEDAVVLPAETDAPDCFRVCLTEAVHSFYGPTQFSLKKEIGTVTLQDGQPIYTGWQENQN